MQLRQARGMTQPAAKRRIARWIPLLMAALFAGGCNFPGASTGVISETDIPVTPYQASDASRHMEAAALVTASSEASDGSASHVIDADPASAWVPEIDEGNQWVQLDLHVARVVGEIRLVFNAGSGAAYRLLTKGPDWETSRFTAETAYRAVADELTVVIAPAAPWTGVQFVRIELRDVDEAFGLQAIEIVAPAEDPYMIEYGDADGDGVRDDADWCPETPGEVAENGC